MREAGGPAQITVPNSARIDESGAGSRETVEPHKTPGGSSSGASASLASGMGTIASAPMRPARHAVRIVHRHLRSQDRAAACPTIRRAYLGTLAVVGPMTRTVADAALCMNVITRAIHATLRVPQDRTSGPRCRTATGLRIAYSPDARMRGRPRDRGDRAGWRQAPEDLGATIEDRGPRADDPSSVLKRSCCPASPMRSGCWIHRGRQGAHASAPRRFGRARRRISVLEFWRRASSASSSAPICAGFTSADLLVTPTLSIPAIGAEEDEPSDPRYRKIKNRTPFNAAFNLSKQPAARSRLA